MVFFVSGLAFLNIMFGLLLLTIALDHKMNREDPVIIVKHVSSNEGPPGYHQ